jgi:hypothetical protein
VALLKLRKIMTRRIKRHSIALLVRTNGRMHAIKPRWLAFDALRLAGAETDDTKGWWPPGRLIRKAPTGWHSPENSVPAHPVRRQLCEILSLRAKVQWHP